MIKLVSVIMVVGLVSACGANSGSHVADENSKAKVDDAKGSEDPYNAEAWGHTPSKESVAFAVTLRDNARKILDSSASTEVKYDGLLKLQKEFRAYEAQIKAKMGTVKSSRPGEPDSSLWEIGDGSSATNSMPDAIEAYFANDPATKSEKLQLWRDYLRVWVVFKVDIVNKGWDLQDEIRKKRSGS